MKNNDPFLDNFAADDLFIEADMRDDVLADMIAPAIGIAAAVTAAAGTGDELYPTKPNPNFPDIDFDEHEDAGEDFIEDFILKLATSIPAGENYDSILKQLNELRTRF